MSKFLQIQESSMEFKEIDVKEDKKNLDSISKIWEDMFEKSIQRSSTVMCIGGGVLSDTVGFAASTYKRGTGLVIIPTTLLSMVDAAHGGKNGINTIHGKNQIGTFMMPDQVLICPEFLDELPEKEIKSGLIELIKAGFLKNPELVEQVYEADITKINTELIKSAVDIKNEITKNDYKETSERMFLNFGHTIGHAIEAYFSFKTYSHGQCVAYGMLAVIELAEKKGCLNPQDAHTLITFIQAFRYHNVPLRPLDHDAIIALIQRDKKVQHGNVTFILPTGNGAVARDTTVSAAEIRASLTWLATCCAPQKGETNEANSCHTWS